MEIKFNNVTYKENIKTPLEKTYLRDVTVEIKENTITTFLGDAESGKSYIGELLNMVVMPTFGSVEALGFINNGKRIKNINTLRMNVGYVSVNPNDMLFNKYVKDELEFGIKYFNYKTDKKSIRLEQALELVDLPKEYLNKKIIDLNLIEKKKIALASVLVFNPKLIILDEPTIGIGTKEKEELKKLITLLKEKYHKTIIILTKDTDFAYEISEDVFILLQGSLVYHGDSGIMLDEKTMNNYNLKVPEILKFINVAKEHNIELTPTSNILDLIKEVYRNAK